MSYTKKTFAATMSELRDTFEKWGISRWSVTPQVGSRRISQSADERRVTVRWVIRGQQLVITLGEWDRDADNLRAIYNSIEALRLMEVRGIAGVIRDLLPQLPLPGGTLAAPKPVVVATDPYAVLGVSPDLALDVIEATWKARLKTAHPDRGGDTAAAARLNEAMAAIRKLKVGAEG